jgi:hypothetical protein
MKAGDADKQHQQEVEAEGRAQELFCTAGTRGTTTVGGGFETTTLPLF